MSDCEVGIPVKVNADYRFADCLGVVGIVLVGFYERLDELWRHQLDSVASSVQEACPVVRASACL